MITVKFNIKTLHKDSKKLKNMYQPSEGFKQTMKEANYGCLVTHKPTKPETLTVAFNLEKEGEISPLDELIVIYDIFQQLTPSSFPAFEISEKCLLNFISDKFKKGNNNLSKEEFKKLGEFIFRNTHVTEEQIEEGDISFEPCHYLFLLIELFLFQCAGSPEDYEATLEEKLTLIDFIFIKDYPEIRKVFILAKSLNKQIIALNTLIKKLREKIKNPEISKKTPQDDRHRQPNQRHFPKEQQLNNIGNPFDSPEEEPNSPQTNSQLYKDDSSFSLIPQNDISISSGKQMSGFEESSIRYVEDMDEFDQNQSDSVNNSEDSSNEQIGLNFQISSSSSQIVNSFMDIKKPSRISNLKIKNPYYFRFYYLRSIPFKVSSPKRKMFHDLIINYITRSSHWRYIAKNKDLFKYSNQRHIIGDKFIDSMTHFPDNPHFIQLCLEVAYDAIRINQLTFISFVNFVYFLIGMDKSKYHKKETRFKVRNILKFTKRLEPYLRNTATPQLINYFYGINQNLDHCNRYDPRYDKYAIDFNNMVFEVSEHLFTGKLKLDQLRSNQYFKKFYKAGQHSQGENTCRVMNYKYLMANVMLNEEHRFVERINITQELFQQLNDKEEEEKFLKKIVLAEIELFTHFKNTEEINYSMRIFLAFNKGSSRSKYSEDLQKEIIERVLSKKSIEGLSESDIYNHLLKLRCFTQKIKGVLLQQALKILGEYEDLDYVTKMINSMVTFFSGDPTSTYLLKEMIKKKLKEFQGNEIGFLKAKGQFRTIDMMIQASKEDFDSIKKFKNYWINLFKRIQNKQITISELEELQGIEDAQSSFKKMGKWNLKVGNKIFTKADIKGIIKKITELGLSIQEKKKKFQKIWKTTSYPTLSRFINFEEILLPLQNLNIDSIQVKNYEEGLLAIENKFKVFFKIGKWEDSTLLTSYLNEALKKRTNKIREIIFNNLDEVEQEEADKLIREFYDPTHSQNNETQVPNSQIAKKKIKRVSLPAAQRLLKRFIANTIGFFENLEEISLQLHLSWASKVNSIEFQLIEQILGLKNKSDTWITHHCLLELYYSAPKLMKFKNQYQTAFRKKFKFTKDQTFFSFLEKLTKKTGLTTSKMLQSLLGTEFNDLDQLKPFLSKPIFPVLTSIEALKMLGKYVKNGGEKLVVDIQNNGEQITEKFLIEYNNLESLRKVLRVFQSSLNESQFFKMFSKLQNQICSEGRGEELLAALSDCCSIKDKLSFALDEYLNTNEAEKNKLKLILEQSEFQFKVGEDNIYTMSVVKRQSRRKDQHSETVYNFSNLLELRQRLSINSFSKGIHMENVDDVQEAELLKEKCEVYLKIFKHATTIITNTQEIFESGFVSDMEKAIMKQDEEEYEDIFNILDNSTFSVMVTRYNKKIVEYFQVLEERISYVRNNMIEVSQQILKEPKHHWLTHLNGSHYRLISEYISKKRQVSKTMNLIKYCFPEITEVQFNELISKYQRRGDQTTEEYHTLQILKELGLNQFSFNSSLGDLRALTRSKDKIICFLDYKGGRENCFEILNKFLAMSKKSMSPSHSSYFFCSRYTTNNEITSFFQRVFLDQKKRKYYCMSLHSLKKEMFDIFMSTLNEYIHQIEEDDDNKLNPNLLIFVENEATSESKYREILHKLSHKVNMLKPFAKISLEDTDDMEKRDNRMESILPKNVTFVISDMAGCGKSEYINSNIKRKGLKKIVLFLAGELSPTRIMKRLNDLFKKLSKLTEKACLHIKLDLMEGDISSVGDIDNFLYQILFLNCCPFGSSFIFFDKISHFYIEVGNTFKQVLLNNSHCLELFYRTKPSTTIRLSGISLNTINSGLLKSHDFELVTNMLQMIKLKKLEKHSYNSFKSRGHLELSNQERKTLMMDYFTAGHKSPRPTSVLTFSQLIVFLDILKRDFSKFLELPLSIEALKFSGRKTSLRTDILGTAIVLARKYAWSTISDLRSIQKKTKKLMKRNGKKDFEDRMMKYKTQLESISKWEDWNDKEDCQIFFGEGCLKFLYKDPTHLRTEMKELIKMNNFDFRRNSGSIPDYRCDPDDDTQDNSLVITEICQAVGQGLPSQIENFQMRKNEFGNGQGYTIIRDNYIKIMLIIQRAEQGIPVVIQGETGCGKTYMINFIATCLLQEQFKCFTLNRGVTPEELVQRLCFYFKIANNLPEKKKLWILLDEFNTSPLQILVEEIVKERTCSFSSKIAVVPKNIVFVLCCNPIQVRTRSKKMIQADLEFEVGLNLDDPIVATLSHKVYPIPEGLMNYVWDFGQLPEKTEEKYITRIIQSTQNLGCPLLHKKKTKKVIQKIISNSQKYIRSLENASSVSLRDVQRFITIFKYLSMKYFEGKFQTDKLVQKEHSSEHNPEYTPEQLYLLIQSVVATSIMCYCMRIAKSSSKKEMYKMIDNSIQRIFNLKVKSKSMFADQVRELALRVKQLGCVPTEISLNRPFKENLFVGLICLETNTPLMICGKPGTSKTIATSVITSMLQKISKSFGSMEENNLSSDKQQYKFFTDRFRSCRIYYFWGSLQTTSKSLKDRFDKAFSDPLQKDENQVVIFDEIGLAEKSEDNPLKVLHAALDPSSEDNPIKLKHEMDKMIQRNKAKKKKENRQSMVNIESSDSDYTDDEEILKATLKESQKNNSARIAPRKLSFIGLSNWKLDDSKMNRMLFIARTELGEEDLLDSCLSIFESVITEKPKIKNSQNFTHLESEINNYFQSISKAYQNFRKEEMKGTGNPNFHGARDFYSLIKFVVESVSVEFIEEREDIEKNLNSVFNYGINKNFSGRIIQGKKASASLKSGFNKILEGKGYRTFGKYVRGKGLNFDVIELIKQNVQAPKSRHLMIFTDGGYIDNAFIEKIKFLKKFGNKRPKVKYFCNSQTDDDVFNITSQLPHFISQDYVMILKNVDKVHGLLYDLFNQKYTDMDGKLSCFLLYNDQKRRMGVHKNFRCIVLMNKKNAHDERKLEAPFLNRFEKHIIGYEDLMTKDELQTFNKFKLSMKDSLKNLKKKSEFEGNYSSLIHNYSEELLVSMVTNKDSIDDQLNRLITTPFDEPDQQFGMKTDSGKTTDSTTKFNGYMKILIRLCTRAMVLIILGEYKTERNLSKRTRKENKTILQYTKTHPNQNFGQLLDHLVDSQTPLKMIVFTHSPAYEVDSLLMKYDRKGQILKLNAVTLKKEGNLRAEITIKNYLKMKKNVLLIVFTEKSEWDNIEYFKNIFDDLLSEQSEEEDRLEYSDKKVIFLALWSSADFENSKSMTTSINFLTTDWSMQTLDELNGMNHENYFKLMRMNVEEFINENTEVTQVFNDYIIEILKCLYKPFICGRQEKLLFHKIINFYRSYPCFQNVIRNKILDSLKSHKWMKKKLFDCIMENKDVLGLISNFKQCIFDFIEKLCKNKIKETLEKIEYHSSFLTRVILEELPESELRTSKIQSWEAQIKDSHLHPRRSFSHGRTRRSTSNIEFKNNCLHSTLRSSQDKIKGLFEKMVNNQQYKNKFLRKSYKVKVASDSKKQMKRFAESICISVQEKEKFFNSTLHELNKKEVVRHWIGQGDLKHQNLKEMTKFIDQISLLDSIINQGEQGTYKDLAGFIAFICIHSAPLEILAAIFQHGDGEFLQNSSVIKQIRINVQNNQPISIDAIVLKNISSLLIFETTRELQIAHKRLQNIYNSSFDNPENKSVDYSIKHTLDILIIFQRHLLFSKVNRLDELFSYYISFNYQIIESLKKMETAPKFADKGFISVIEILMKHGGRSRELTKEILDMLMLEIQEIAGSKHLKLIMKYFDHMLLKGDSMFKKNYARNKLAGKIGMLIEIDLETLEVSQNSLLSQDDFNSCYPLRPKVEVSLNFYMFLGDKIVQKFRRAFDKIPKREKANTLQNSLEILKTRDLLGENLESSREYLQFLTNISALRFIFSYDFGSFSGEGEPKDDFVQTDRNIIDYFYKNADFKFHSLYMLQSLSNSVQRQSVLTDLNMDKCLTLLKEFQESNSDIHFIPPSSHSCKQLKAIKLQITGKQSNPQVQPQTNGYRLSNDLQGQYAEFMLGLTTYKAKTAQKTEPLFDLFTQGRPFFSHIYDFEISKMKTTLNSTELKVMEESKNYLLSSIIHFFGVAEILVLQKVDFITQFMEVDLTNFDSILLPMKRPNKNLIDKVDLKNADKSATTYWTCSCGYSYSLGQCGKLNEQAECLDCGKRIGGIGKHKAGQDNGQRKIGNYQDLIDEINNDLKEMKTGYTPHEPDDLDWSIKIYPHLKNYQTAIISHLVSHLLLLYRERKADVAFGSGNEEMVKYYLTHIIHDFSLLKDYLKKDWESIYYLVNLVFFLLLAEIRKNQKVKLKTFFINLAKTDLQDCTLSIINYKNMKKLILNETSDEFTVYKSYIARVVDLKEIRKIVTNPSKITVIRLLRNYKEFSDEDRKNLIPGFEEKFKVSSRLKKIQTLLRNFSKILMCLIELCDYLTDSYSFKITREQAKECTLLDFFEDNHEDEKLERLYSQLKENKDDLKNIALYYSSELKFKIDCEQENEFINQITNFAENLEDQPLMRILLVGERSERRTDEEVFLQVLLDAFIGFQSKLIEDFEEEFNKINQIKDKDIGKIELLEFDHITKYDLICLTDEMAELLKGNYYSNPMFLREDEFNYDQKEADSILKNRFLSGKKKLKSISKTSKSKKFKFKNDQSENHFSELVEVHFQKYTNKESIKDKQLLRRIQSTRVTIKTVQGIENTFSNIMTVVAENNHTDTETICSSLIEENDFLIEFDDEEDLRQIKGMLGNLKIKHMEHLSNLLLIKRGKWLYKELKKEKKTSEMKSNLKSLRKTISEKGVLRNMNKIKKITNEILLVIAKNLDQISIKTNGEYEAKYLPELFPLCSKLELINGFKLKELPFLLELIKEIGQ